MSLLRTTNSLIKRYTFPAVFRQVAPQQINENNWIDSVPMGYNTFQFLVEYCTIQNVRNDDDILQSLPSGISADQMYTLITNTPLVSPIDGNNGDIGCSIYIPDFWWTPTGSTSMLMFSGQGGWYRVIKANNRFGGLQDHCQALLVKDSTPKDKYGNEKYPDMTPVFVDTPDKATFITQNWVDKYPDTLSTAGLLYQQMNEPVDQDTGDPNNSNNWDNNWVD